VEPIVIIGTGLAGYTVAKELRRLTLDRRVVLLTRDSGAWYSKPMLSNALAAGKTPDTLASAGAAQLSQQLSIEVRTRLEVLRIVPQRHDLETSAGPMRYSSLVFALGADPVPLAICDGLPNAYAVNDLDDYGRFRSAIGGARRIAILGDCAQVNGCHLPYVLPLMHCARAFAKTLTGERTRVTYPAMPIVVKTPALPMTVVSPETGVRGKWHIEASGRDVAAMYSNLNGELAGFALTGAANGRKAALVRKMAENRDSNRESSGEDFTLIATSRS
jgi:NAD(P)H-nitrite reductase large subunit